MEQDRFDVLPAPVFAKGFLREYARYVGLNPDEVVNFFLSAHRPGTAEDDEEQAPAAPGGRIGSSPWTAGALLALVGLVLLALVAYFAFTVESRREGRPGSGRSAAPGAGPGAPPAASMPRRPTEPPPSGAAAAAPERAAPLEVTLDFTGECWVEVVIDGRERISELHVQGESLQLAAEHSVLLANVGNPAGVEVQVNGEPFDLGGQAGRPVKDVLIDLPEVESPAPGTAPP